MIIAERFRFYKHSLRRNKSLAYFHVELCRLSIKCEFGDFLEASGPALLGRNWLQHAVLVWSLSRW